jgi:Zn-finger nucleic acid-binding protein
MGTSISTLISTLTPSGDPAAGQSCPDCGASTLMPVGTRRFQLKHCTACGGTWLEAGQVARLRTEVTPRWKAYLVQSAGPELNAIIDHVLDQR